MRTFKILKNCIDKHTGRQLPAGTILEVDEARAKELEAAPAYASEIKKPVPKQEPAPDPEPVKDPEEEKPKKAPAKKKTAGRKKKEA